MFKMSISNQTYVDLLRPRNESIDADIKGDSKHLRSRQLCISLEFRHIIFYYGDSATAPDSSSMLL